MITDTRAMWIIKGIVNGELRKLSNDIYCNIHTAFGDLEDLMVSEEEIGDLQLVMIRAGDLDFGDLNK